MPARVNQHVAIIRTKPKEVNFVYLCHYLISENYKNLLLNKATLGGATREALTKEQLENIEILLPPLELQTKFAGIVEKTELVKKDLQNSLQELENLYGSLSQKAFKGELDLSGVKMGKLDDYQMVAEPEVDYKKSKK